MLDPTGVVKQQRQAIGGIHPEVVRTLGTHLMVGFQFLVVNHLAAGRTFDPEALGNPARFFRLSLDGFPGLLEPRHACTLASDAGAGPWLASRSSERSERPCEGWPQPRGT